MESSPGGASSNPLADFEDVPVGHTFYNAIMWGVGLGITNGTTKTTFSPNTPCTVQTILVFIWRAMGCPEPQIENPFDNVQMDKYYAEAAVWAFEHGLVNGTEVQTANASTEFWFDGTADCSRGDTVIFLYRMKGSQSVEDLSLYEFADVTEATPELRNAVAWAKKFAITDGRGMDEKTGLKFFYPWETCTRAHVMAFLYRCLDSNA